ncbi:hypothetical protein TRIUR3_26809 [Triticum urartu]|uniref:Uncharacterized protein n=1 Tax=Triticum urartu TaxID=4572 RepID=M8AIV1_TRIUA|nr:hypothetical protein TRIUR3_26809 [Triticum urartu]
MEHLVSLLLQGGPATALWRSRPLPSVGHRLLLLQAVPHPPIPAADRPFTAGTTVRSLPTTEAVQRCNDEFIYLPVVSPITYVFPCSSYSMRRFVDAQQSLQTAMLNNVNSSGSLDWSWYRIHLKLGLGTGYILSWSSSLSSY